MTLLYLVRHGRAAAGWDASMDPGLDRIGRAQATELAARLADLGPLPIVASPYRRCQETAAPLARRWRQRVTTEAAVGEIPSPPGVAMDRRTDWLRVAMRGTWADLEERYAQYRDQVVAFVTGLTEPTVVVSHFVAINAVIGAATADDRVVIRSLDNTSVTVVDVGRDEVRVVEGGHEADTLIR